MDKDEIGREMRFGDFVDWLLKHRGGVIKYQCKNGLFRGFISPEEKAGMLRGLFCLLDIEFYQQRSDKWWPLAGKTEVSICMTQDGWRNYMRRGADDTVEIVNSRLIAVVYPGRKESYGDGSPVHGTADIGFLSASALQTV